MTETHHLQNVVIFIQTILGFVLSRKIINICNDITRKYGNVAVKDFRKYEKLECKKNKLKLDIDFLNNWKQIGAYPKFLILNCWIFLIKTLYQFVKDSFIAPPASVTKNPNIFQKNSVNPQIFYLLSFLLLTSTSLQNLYHRITKKCCRNRYTLNKKSYIHCKVIATYLYLQLTKLLLISCNMNYPRKNLIYLKNVYTFQSNQIKFENPKPLLLLKRFIVHFLTTLNPRKPKVR